MKDLKQYQYIWFLLFAWVLAIYLSYQYWLEPSQALTSNLAYNFLRGI